MATTKTIQPTGTTITIPAMTDRPDASVYSTDVERITDAVNAVNSNLVTANSYRMSCLKKNTAGSGGTLTFTYGNAAARYSAILFITQNNNNNGVYVISGKAQTGFAVVKLGGTFDNITVDQSNGTISVTLGTWSQATLLHDAADGDFT